jgi:hypothetical protein
MRNERILPVGIDAATAERVDLLPPSWQVKKLEVADPPWQRGIDEQVLPFWFKAEGDSQQK